MKESYPIRYKGVLNMMGQRLVRVICEPLEEVLTEMLPSYRRPQLPEEPETFVDDDPRWDDPY